MISRRSVLLFVGLLGCEPSSASRRAGPAETPAAPATAAGTSGASAELGRDQALALLCGVLAERDEDCDRRITVEDERLASERAARSGTQPDQRWPFVARTAGVEIRLDELHHGAQLVQELVLALRRPSGALRLETARVRADPASYLAYRVEEHFWDALTRRIDASPEHLERAAADEKLGDAPVGAADLCRERAPRCGSATSGNSDDAGAVPKRELFVYYPAGDARAGEVFGRASVPGRISVLPLPDAPSADWVLATTRAGRHGLLTLSLDAHGKGRPFVVPGGRFNEMYGWDSFFIVWGLVQDPRRIELARAMVDNHAYEIAHYGKILNANRTYYLTRSQPPFFTSAIREVWQRLPATDGNRRWLASVLGAAIAEYRQVWANPPRRLGLCDGDVCLARYFGEGRGEPPEVERGHFDWFYQTHAVSHGHCARPREDAASRERFLACVTRFAERHRSGALADAAVDRFFTHDRCVRESGHDTTYRWYDAGEERCADHATVDLNALLFKYEVDIATLVREVFGGSLGSETSAAFCRRAEARARLFERYLWDEKAGAFFDFDTKRGRRSGYLSATTLYPLWASSSNTCGVRLVTPDEARRVVRTALAELEAPGGLYATAPSSLARVEVPAVLERTGAGDFATRRPGRQWEAPSGWAPHQMLAWAGLRAHGFAGDAERLAYRWLYTIVENSASFHGTVPEKFDVAKRSHAVFAEYGNVNTEFSYIAEEGFGWMNASFIVGWNELAPALRAKLAERVPPERLSFAAD